MLSFPKDFLWGCSTAAYQIEGHPPANDWRQWETKGKIFPRDSAELANNAYQRFREDAQLLADLHQNAHRLSIEWARVEPNPGEFDAAQIEHYRQVLTAYRERGMQTMVTLHHFTSPLWFSERGGWSASGSEQAWLPFVRRVAQELGELVNFWCTINEPNIYAIYGWLRGGFPPGNKGDLLGCLRVLSNFRRGHVAAYRELKQLTPEIPVGIAQHKWISLPASSWWNDRLAAYLGSQILDCWPNGWRLERVIDAPSDYLGINHYSGSLFKFDISAYSQGFISETPPPGLPVDEQGFAINPLWMGDALAELKGRGKPVYITENGIATLDDRFRMEYLDKSLHQVHQAIAQGADVRGYFHWTSLDNFEWQYGFSMHFGLIGVDIPTQVRTLRESGRWFADVARNNALSDSTMKQR